MAGYSKTPLARKLGIRAGARIVLVRAPEGFAESLDALPEGVRIGRRLSGRCGFVLAFCARRRDIDDLFERVLRVLERDGMLWVAWPKKSSGQQTDLGEADVRASGLDSGLVDVKICAVDETWSALKFVYRLTDR